MSDSAPAPFDGNAWELARAMQDRGVSSADIAVELTRRGLDEESVRVLLGSLPGAPTPSALPEAQFDLGTNPLAPKVLALSSLGMEGDRRVVALYWLVFGGALALLTTGGLFLGWANVFESSSTTWGVFGLTALPWVGYSLAALSLLRGLFLLRR